jgi:hypothetical protein
MVAMVLMVVTVDTVEAELVATPLECTAGKPS